MILHIFFRNLFRPLFFWLILSYIRCLDDTSAGQFLTVIVLSFATSDIREFTAVSARSAILMAPMILFYGPSDRRFSNR